MGQRHRRGERGGGEGKHRIRGFEEPGPEEGLGKRGRGAREGEVRRVGGRRKSTIIKVILQYQKMNII
jgi:hypothetical protein